MKTMLAYSVKFNCLYRDEDEDAKDHMGQTAWFAVGSVEDAIARAKEFAMKIPKTIDDGYDYEKRVRKNVREILPKGVLIKSVVLQSSRLHIG